VSLDGRYSMPSRSPASPLHGGSMPATTSDPSVRLSPDGRPLANKCRAFVLTAAERAAYPGRQRFGSAPRRIARYRARAGPRGQSQEQHDVRARRDGHLLAYVSRRGAPDSGWEAGCVPKSAWSPSGTKMGCLESPQLRHPSSGTRGTPS
jgi:hypothetical protein